MREKLAVIREYNLQKNNALKTSLSIVKAKPSCAEDVDLHDLLEASNIVHEKGWNSYQVIRRAVVDLFLFGDEGSGYEGRPVGGGCGTCSCLETSCRGSTGGSFTKLSSKPCLTSLYLMTKAADKKDRRPAGGGCGTCSCRGTSCRGSAAPPAPATAPPDFLSTCWCG